MGRIFPVRSGHISRKIGSIGPQSDLRFTLHHRQPRADKLDAGQRKICRADTAFAHALSKRVADPRRFAAFMAGASSYIRFGDPCAKCGSYRRRTRDRSCYGCHLQRSGANFERMKAGIAPKVTRNKDSHLDILERQRREQEGEYLEREFDGLVARRWPMGRLDITFPNGYHEPDMSKLNYHGMKQAISEFPQLVQALEWAGWTIPG